MDSAGAFAEGGAHFADGHKAGIPKEELEKVRLEFAKALEMMEDRSD